MFLYITMNEPLTVILEEFLVHELSDLVADLGGYLGLLLGASLYTIYEVVEVFVERFRGSSGTARK